jgi:hypothetical protein
LLLITYNILWGKNPGALHIVAIKSTGFQNERKDEWETTPETRLYERGWEG